MKPGYYSAKVLNWKLAFSEKGTPMVDVTFGIGEEKYYYRGFLTEKGKQYTVKDLVTLGFKDKDLGRFAMGLEGGALDTTQEYRVKLKEEEWKGKTYLKVKSIYPSKFSAEKAYDMQLKGGQISVGAEVLAAQADLGGSARLAGSEPNKVMVDADLPF